MAQEIKIEGWVGRKTSDGVLKLWEDKKCSGTGIWLPPWAINDSWKICTTDEPIKVEITIKRL